MRSGFGILGLVLVVLAGGCAGYQIGPSNGLNAGARTVQVLPFSSRTLEPRLSDAATSALRKEIQRDGTFRLATRDAGDLIVSGEITGLERSEISFLPVDVVTARDYQVGITAHVVVKEWLTGKVVLDRNFAGSTLMRAGTDLPSAERQSLPLMAADLARHITNALADGTW